MLVVVCYNIAMSSKNAINQQNKNVHLAIRITASDAALLDDMAEQAGNRSEAVRLAIADAAVLNEGGKLAELVKACGLSRAEIIRAAIGNYYDREMAGLEPAEREDLLVF